MFCAHVNSNFLRLTVFCNYCQNLWKVSIQCFVLIAFASTVLPIKSRGTINDFSTSMTFPSSLTNSRSMHYTSILNSTITFILLNFRLGWLIFVSLQILLQMKYRARKIRVLFLWYFFSENHFKIQMPEILLLAIPCLNAKNSERCDLNFAIAPETKFQS